MAPYLPDELWLCILQAFSRDIPVLLTVRLVSKRFRAIVAKLPVCIRSRQYKGGYPGTFPRTALHGKLLGEMFGPVIELDLSWTNIAKWPVGAHGPMTAKDHVDAIRAVTPPMQPKTLRLAADNTGWWALDVISLLKLDKVTSLTLDRVLITHKLVLACKDCHPVALSVAAPAGTTLSRHSENLFKTIGVNLRVVNLSSVSDRVVDALHKHCPKLTHVTLINSVIGVNVAPLLKRQSIESLDLCRDAISATKNFTQEFAGLDTWVPDSQLVSLSLTEYWYDVSFEAIQSVDITKWIHMYSRLEALRLSGMCLWDPVLIDQIASGMPRLHVFWYTPTLEEDFLLTPENAVKLANLKYLNALVLSTTSLCAQTATILAKRCKILVAEDCMGPHGHALYFQIHDRHNIGWDAKLALFKGEHLVRPLDFPYDLL